MSYLFGDSSGSGLETNYIDLLRLAIDFCVHAAQADARILKGHERRAQLERVTAVDLEKLERLGEQVLRSIALPAGSSDDSPGSATTRCAATIGRLASEAVRSESAAVRAMLAQAVVALDAEAMREREGTARALEVFLLKHDAPHTQQTCRIELASGTHYLARLQGTTPWGLDVILRLEVPTGNLFAQPVRIDRVAEGFELNVPDTAGWLRKDLKLSPHKLGKDHLVGVTISDDETVLQVRVHPDLADSGYDFVIRDEPGEVTVRRVGREGNGGTSEPFVLGEFDAQKLMGLYAKLAAPLAELFASRKAVLAASLERVPVGEIERPIAIAERLINAMAPMVREIAAHSRSASELVLRRMISADHREEIFVSKSELTKKIEGVSEPGRVIFEPLGLSDDEIVTAVDPLKMEKRTAFLRASAAAAVVPSSPAVVASPPRPLVPELTDPGSVAAPVEDEDWIPIDEDTAVGRQKSPPK